ncbi:MAG: hypothetical protein K940chlam5_00058 [Candidatus Anoxychlamydiales bacterium]|nr:hypothetical protein [Candidatus Anoxychlamydiales bacterium]
MAAVVNSHRGYLDYARENFSLCIIMLLEAMIMISKGYFKITSSFFNIS